MEHRSVHKKACEIRARELFDVQLFAQPPRREDCPICMIPLSCVYSEFTYMSCCGKFICSGCRYCLTRDYCPFCNTAIPSSDKEFIKRLFERKDKYNDPTAMESLGNHFKTGRYGLPVDQSKAVELFKCASELGSASAHFNLGLSYELGEGIEIDMKKAVHHYQIAAMKGNMAARHNLGGAELRNGNFQRAMKHFTIAAEFGLTCSLDVVKVGFRRGHVTKEDFEKTLRTYQASCDETKTEQRDRAAVIARERE